MALCIYEGSREIKTRNQFRAGSPEMQRGWEFWARRAGCGDMLAASKGGV